MTDKKIKQFLRTIRRDIAAGERNNRVDDPRRGADSRPHELREWITIGALLLATGISAFQLYEMRRVYDPVVSQARSADEQTRSAIKSVELAQQALEVGQRPWLSALVSSVDGLTINAEGIRISVRYSIKNNGNTVATNMQRNLSITPYYFGGYDTVSNKPAPDGVPVGLSEAERKCKERGVLDGLLDDADALRGGAVFPAETLEETYTLTMPNNAITKARSDGMALFPAVLVCIRYRSPFDKRFHTTFVSYAITGLGQHRANQFTGGIEPTLGTISVGSLKLERVGNAFAD